MTKENAIVRREAPCFKERCVIHSRFTRVPSLASLFFVAVLAAAEPAAADESTCGSLKNNYGPFDYRSAGTARIQIVEDYHFTPNVEMLKKGESGLLVGGDIDYTLRAFPNHYRALVAMMNLRLKTNKDPPPGARWRVECYFDRAIRFRPDDGRVRMVFGIYLSRSGRNADAITQFEMAEKLGEESGNLHYNAGLAYFELGDYDKALAHAKKAYDLNFALPGLRDKLKKMGKWPAD